MVETKPPSRDVSREEFMNWSLDYGVSAMWDIEEGIFTTQLTQFMWRAFQAGYEAAKGDGEEPKVPVWHIYRDSKLIAVFFKEADAKEYELCRNSWKPQPPEQL